MSIFGNSLRSFNSVNRWKPSMISNIMDAKMENGGAKMRRHFCFEKKVVK